MTALSKRQLRSIERGQDDLFSGFLYRQMEEQMAASGFVPDGAGWTKPADSSPRIQEPEPEPLQKLWQRGATADVEVLHWGPIDERNRTPHGKAGFVLKLWRDGEAWRYMTDTAFHNQWSGGPWSEPYSGTRDELVEAILLRKIDQCARMVAWEIGEDSERRAKEAASLAAWCIDQLSPLFFPTANAQARYDAEVERQRVECQAHRTLARAKHEVEEVGKRAMIEAKRWGYDRLIVDPDSEEGPEWIADARFPGRWDVEGRAPDALRIVIHAKKGKRDTAAILAARNILSTASGLVVSIEGAR